MQLLRLRAIFPIVPLSDSGSSFAGMWKNSGAKAHQVVLMAHLRVVCAPDVLFGGEEKPAAEVTGRWMKLRQARAIEITGDVPLCPATQRCRSNRYLEASRH